MTAKTLHFSCSCGDLKGRLVDVDARTGTHITCYCDDCRTNLAALGQSDPGALGVDIFQTTPDRVRIDEGGQHMRILRLSPKGILRWYAQCCSTPLFNTMTSGTVPFVGVLSDRFENKADLGPVKAKGFVPKEGGGHRHENGLGLMAGMMGRALKVRLKGKHRETPFFDDEGSPTAQQRVLSRQERAEALMRA